MEHTFGDRVTVINHPLVEHKLSVLRDKRTSGITFRQTVHEITLLEGFEATRHLKTDPITIETPLAPCSCRSIARREPVIVPILRAGLAMVEGMLELIPTAPVAHLGMYRNEVTHEPIEYYAKMPSYIAERQVIVVDPMLATGGSLNAALYALRRRNVQDITVMVIVAAPEGIQAVLDADPDVRIFACAIDKGLNRDAYILPGLGDAGDRIFQTERIPVESSYED